MKKTIYLSFILPLLFAGCISDESGTPQSKGYPIIVEVSDNPMLSEDGTPLLTQTRAGNPIDAESLKTDGFNLSYFSGSDVNTGICTYSTTWVTSDLSWPGNHNEEIDFYAYNGGTLNYGDGNPYVHFTVEGDVGSQKDLLVAKTSTSYNNSNGKVNLNFDHACSAVKFYIKKTDAVGGKSIQVTSVQLSNVKYKGDYYFSPTEGPKWKSLDGSATYELSNSTITLTTDMQELSCGYLYLIPQSKAGITLTVKFTGGSKAGPYVHTWTSGSWEPGHEYVININMGTAVVGN